ncbi:MAG: MFS transporter [Desulfarculaceae bacterium]|nr:MFS transporter [Desulfarculaceae bacterium]MCF8047215.1 MFS transporter [Desulfarculaceae bacterium]MCF8065380.1 MFS transporter [Desulfarculaceae bacterium]MCF8099038.1 MFS transporter [Desulfarculaceae bacterium]MCF8124311.1 MFS transporter [Desulfarculaceae bacterium]
MTQPSYRSALYILGLTTFVAMTGVGIIVPFLPLYARDLGANGVMLGLIFSSFSLSRAFVVPWLGGLSDRWGRKPFIIAGMAGYGFTSLLFMWAASAEALVFTRLLQGVFAAMVLPIAMALVADITQPGMEGRSFGAFNMFFLMGFGVGPVIGGAVYEYAGLNANFLLMFVLSVAAALTVLFFVKEPSAEVRSGGKRGLREMIQLTRDRDFLAIMVARMGAAAGMSCFISFLPLVATGHGLGTFEVGLCLTANVLVTTAMQRPAGNLADRLPRLPLAVGGLALSGVMKMLIPWGSDLTSLMLLSMAEGVFAGTSLPALTAMAVSRGKALGSGMGLTTGAFTMALSVGVFFGPVSGGWAVDLSGISGAALWLGGGAAVTSAILLWLLYSTSKTDHRGVQAKDLVPVDRLHH